MDITSFWIGFAAGSGFTALWALAAWIAYRAGRNAV